jgi:hypothetical protein
MVITTPVEKAATDQREMKGGATRKLLESRTRLIDVISVSSASKTGIYVLDNGCVRPLRQDESQDGKKLLARTNGLSHQQKGDLKERGTGIYYVREAKMPHGETALLMSSEGYEGVESMHGTVVVPYISLTQSQASSIRTLALLAEGAISWGC